MSKNMNEVLAAHSGTEIEMADYEYIKAIRCGCGAVLDDLVNLHSTPRGELHAAHVAEELAKAGFGDVRKAFGAAADELARLPYVKPGDNGRDEYERMLAIRRGDTDKWLREKAESHGVD